MGIQKKPCGTPLTDAVVLYIVGKKQIQNEVFASFLRHNTGYDCFVFENIEHLPKDHKNPRLVLLDCQTNDLEKMLLNLNTYNMQKQFNNHIIVLNVPPNANFSRQVIQQGVHGFFYEYDSVDTMIKGIKSVIKGRLWFPRGMMSKCILEETEPKPASKHNEEKLTQREIEILSMIAVGKTNQEIAEKLFISPHTVKNHLYIVYKKIRVHNRIQASLWAAINL